MKKVLVFTLALLMLFAATAQAGGLLPSSQSAFGTYMPSLTLALGRSAAQDEKTGEERQVTLRPFTDADYAAFGTYVNAWGCTAQEYTSTADSVTITLKKGDTKVYFTYDRALGTGTVTYPKGTRPEEEKSTKTGGKNAFPAIRNVFGQKMPSMNGVIGKKADRST